MAQPTPKKILEIINDHERAYKKQRNKYSFIYSCFSLLIFGVVASSLESTSILNNLYLTKGLILGSKCILSMPDKTKDFPEIRQIVITRLLSGSKLTVKDKNDIFSQLKNTEQNIVIQRIIR
ncbi:hypothetical protein ACI28F_003613 [Escherichia coli]|nr:hypothetical protein [Escherichia coli]EEQ4619994.1 hypothetical protein [Escherichia coli]EEQ7471890.1 hypothetical protein [Escherichia coli]EEQ7473597.1 hypothetical protein [Escherichia coli]EEQ8093960.1 hypothetical protein [Escherichia coli]